MITLTHHKIRTVIKPSITITTNTELMLFAYLVTLFFSKLTPGYVLFRKHRNTSNSSSSSSPVVSSSSHLVVVVAHVFHLIL